MPTTSNFGWTTPADTDLVKDGAAAIRTLGNGIDTSLVDLKGGTTGQILSKNSNTDLDYIWINNDQGDITAVTAGTGLTGGGTTGAVTLTNDMATTITAAGDIVVGTGSGTYDNLPIGTTGQILTADTTVSPYKVKWASPTAAGFVGCRAYLSTGFQVTLNTATAINWDAESFDTDGFHSTSTNTSRFTVPVGKAGKYRISYRGLITLDDGKQYIAEIYLNGSAITNERRNSGLNSFSTSKVDDVRNLAENDYIQIYLYQTQATQNVEPGEGTSYIIFEYLGA